MSDVPDRKDVSLKSLALENSRDFLRGIFQIDSYNSPVGIPSTANKIEQAAKAEIADPTSSNSKALVDQLNSLHNHEPSAIEDLNYKFAKDKESDSSIPTLILDATLDGATAPADKNGHHKPAVIGSVSLIADQVKDNGKEIFRTSINAETQSTIGSQIYPAHVETSHYKQNGWHDGLPKYDLVDQKTGLMELRKKTIAKLRSQFDFVHLESDLLF